MSPAARDAIVAGHYCHDTLVSNDGTHHVLGGSVAYAQAVLAALGARVEVASKVGEDFLYGADVPAPPRRVAGPTTAFTDDVRAGERSCTLTALCAPLEPDDLPGPCTVALACPIAGELPPRTLLALRGQAQLLLCDVQGFLRTTVVGRAVENRRLEETELWPLLDRVDYLKASRRECEAFELETVRRRTVVLLTDGARGCTILDGRASVHVPPFAAHERDATGAGDSFLAGFAAGLLRGMAPDAAARLGNFCGARAVEQVGVPRWPRDLFAAFEAA